MNYYCVSDIHGRYDFLLEGLKRIEFDLKKDKLFILGDVCNGGSESLKIYDFILNNQNSVTLLKGNHDIFLIKILKVFQEVLKYNDIFDALKKYVVNYVSGFEKNRDKACREQTCKYATTERRKICIQTYKNYVSLAKQYKIENFHYLVNFYESFFKTRKLMFELINNPSYDYETLINFISQCECIKTVFIKKEKWVMFHSRYSEKHESYPPLDCQLIDRLNRSYISNSVNYIYGHTPIPKVHSCFTREKLNYNKILKAIDYKNNKYFNIDVSHFGICFLNLKTLEEVYVGNSNNLMIQHNSCRFENFIIEDITEPYSRIKRFLIKYEDYFLALVVLNKKEKKLTFYEFCSLFQNLENHEFAINDEIDMKKILNIFLNTKNKL